MGYSAVPKLMKIGSARFSDSPGHLFHGQPLFAGEGTLSMYAPVLGWGLAFYD